MHHMQLQERLEMISTVLSLLQQSGSRLSVKRPALGLVQWAGEVDREHSTRSKWLKEERNSCICSWLMPLASRVRIWVSISLMVRAMVVRSNSQPTRICCGYHGDKEGMPGHCHGAAKTGNIPNNLNAPESFLRFYFM